jgi:hypothetical protein
LKAAVFARQQAGIALQVILSMLLNLSLVLLSPALCQLNVSNATARRRPGCKLFLTKPLGIGVLTTAEKIAAQTGTYWSGNRGDVR